MVVGPDGRLPLPWLAAPLAAALGGQRGHALLVHGAPGVGAMEFSLVLAQAWLCEADAALDRPPARPCGRCASCHLVHQHLHPDLFVLMPEVLRREHGWPLADDKAEGEDGKRKPSKQIRIDEVRALVDRISRTTARGRGKVAVLHPADALNLQSASALLKTLEEPPAGTRLVLTAAEPSDLLPTVRSRCQRLALGTPPPEQAAAWLSGQGVLQPEVLLKGCGGRPLDALALARGGVDAAAWSDLPMALAQGRVGMLAGWPMRVLVDAMLKVCHDAMARAAGAATRFFAADQVPARAALPRLLSWRSELLRVARDVEHPWNEPLALDALTAAAALALTPPPSGGAGTPGRTRLDTLAP